MKLFTKNPATGKEIQEYSLESADQVMSRVQRAHTQYMSWRKVSVSKRAELIGHLEGILQQKCDQLAELITTEMGKTLKEAKGEVLKCATLCKYYAENSARWLENESVTADGEEHLIIYQPLGIVLTIMPWNFPFWQALRFAVPAIASGNVAILKHSNVVAGCALAIEGLFYEAGFPIDTFQTCITDHAVTAKLIKDDRISGISFTGSTEVGKKIGEMAGKSLKKVVLELGGSDPFIVLEDADIEAAAIGATAGRLINAGQSCIAAKRFIVVESIAKDFIERFVHHMSSKKIGDPMLETSDLGPLVDERSLQEIGAQVDDATQKGAKLECGGKRVNGNYFEPTVLSGVNSSMRVAFEEVFGPVAPVIIVRDLEEALVVANGTEFGLGASIWTKDVKLARAVALELEAGTIFVNSIVKSDPRMPFGGVKNSGIGRELSRFGLMEFVNIKGYSRY